MPVDLFFVWEKFKYAEKTQGELSPFGVGPLQSYFNYLCDWSASMATG